MVEYTKRGSQLTRGFSWASSFDKDYALYESYLKKGYEKLYFGENYYWGVVNIPERKIFTYTEGDILLIEAPDVDHLIGEIEDYYNFLRAKGNEPDVYGGIPLIIERLKGKSGVVNEKIITIWTDDITIARMVADKFNGVIQTGIWPPAVNVKKEVEQEARDYLHNLIELRRQ